MESESMDTRRYDLNVCNRSKEFYHDVLETWEKWTSKPKDPKIRLGYLGEAPDHPEFLDILQEIKPAEYFTCGRILGTPGDPRQGRYLSETIRIGAEVILKWSSSPYYQRAFQELREAKIPVRVLVEESEGFVWKEDTEYLLTDPIDLKDRKNTSLIEYYKNILLTDKKVIITRNPIDLKPITIYDRV